jgi:hypothetical protein
MLHILNSRVLDRVQALFRVHRSEYMVHILNSRVLERVHDLMLVHAIQYMTAQGDFHLRVHFVPVLAQPSVFGSMLLVLETLIKLSIVSLSILF